VWHGFLSLTRQFLKGWCANRMGESKKLKKELLLKLETLEAVGEENMDETTWRERYEIEARMDQELIKDEMYWQQRGALGGCKY
jgi:hypothetical protein